MHNKSFIVDNVVAIVGGRNIGDAYFDASRETNFSDLDVIAIGKVVRQASQAFDEYWNSDAAYPVKAFRDRHVTAEKLTALRAQLKAHARAFAETDYAQAILGELPNGPTADRRGQWFWGAGELVADQPEKIEVDHDVPSFRIGPQVKAIMDAAQQQLLLISPYFIPGESGVEYLGGIAGRGVDVEAVTNSLAATDEPATSYGQSSGICLHAKAVVADRRYVFIGSMNMDERSKLLNTEMGVIVDSPPLAAAVADFFASATAPASAFALRLSGSAEDRRRKVQWISTDADGKQVVSDTPPGATAGRRVEATLMRMLPIESLL
jgi:putative cardiolipin synthase